MRSAFSRILVPTDFSPESKAALRAAASLASGLHGSIHLLHVARDPVLSVGTPEVYGLDWVKMRDEIASEAMTRLKALAQTVSGVRVTREVVMGSPAEAIARVAEDTNAGLIVMGTQGRGILGQLLIGSVADRVIRQARCPVMTVREFGAVRLTASGSERTHGAQAS